MTGREVVMVAGQTIECVQIMPSALANAHGTEPCRGHKYMLSECWITRLCRDCVDEPKKHETSRHE